MSTQTQFTAKSAEEFLKKYATVVGTNKAIEDKNSDFLLKYATVVGTPEAVAIYAPTEPAVVSDDTEDPVEPTVPPTNPEEGSETGDVTGDPVVEGEENE